MRLLPKEALIKTGPVDHADWNYKPLLGSIQRMRFTLAMRMLGKQHHGRLLELGCGSGIFLPELSRHCVELYGIDVHAHTAEVEESLARQGVAASLFEAPGEELPFEDGTLDCVVAVSSLEFVTDLDAVCQEVRRVLRPDGRFVVITPGSSPLLDFGLRVLTGKSAKTDFGDRRSLILPAIERCFHLQQAVRAIGGLYLALDARPKVEAGVDAEPVATQLQQVAVSDEVEQAILAARRRRVNAAQQLQDRHQGVRA